MSEETKQEETRYYGKYRALVTNNQDPKKQLRVKCNIPSLLGGYESGWAMPCVPLLGNTEGLFKLPQVGDGLWVEFESGDLNYPIYVGGWSNPSKVPVDDYAHADKVMQIQTRCGHKIQIDDVNNMVVLETTSKGRSMGTRIEIDSNANVRVIGSLTVTGDVEVKGTTTSQGKLTVNDSASIKGNANVGGTTTSVGKLTVKSSASIYDNTYIGGDTEIQGDTMIAKQLDVGEQIIAVGSITTEKNLFVDGGARISQAVNIYGKTNITDNLTVNADEVNIEANVKVLGDSEFEGALKHKGDIDFTSSGDIILDGNVESTGDLRAEGTVSAGPLGFVTDGTLFVVGDATVGGNLSGSTAKFSGNVEAPNIP